MIVQCSSHRARERLLARLPDLQAMWHITKGNHYGCYAVSPEQLPKARAVKGVPQIRGDTADWATCWPTGNPS